MEPTFEDFVLARGEVLLRLALMLTGDRHHAEDLVQSVLTKAYLRWDRVAAMERPEAYLKKVLVNDSVCIYHSPNIAWTPPIDGRLRASRTLTGDLAAHLAAGLNAAKPGGNPDPPASECTQERPVVPDAMLIVHGGGITTAVWVTFGSCTGRGLDNGVRRSQLTMSLTFEIMQRFGFSMLAQLPQ